MKKCKFLTEFKEFAMRGNVVDMAVGIIIGGAFGKIVSSAVADLIMPLVGLLLGGINFADLSVTLSKETVDAAGEVVPAVTLNYGNFIQVSVDFIIIAFAIFLIVKLIAKLSRKKEAEAAAAEPAAPSAEVQLLTEIRDLMQKQNEK